MSTPKHTYSLQVRRWQAGTDCTLISETMFHATKKAKAAFLAEVGQHLAYANMTVDLLRKNPPIPDSTWQSGATVLACKHRNSNMAELHLAWFTC